jgi:hypothetical protein
MMSSGYTTRRALQAAASALLLAACADEHREIPRTLGARAGCESRAGGSRWSSGGVGYRATASYGRQAETWLNEVAGVAAVDSLVFVYDAPQSRVVMLDGRLQPVRSFGRKGQGPGELAPVMDRGRRGLGWKWIDGSGDSLLVFDGTRLQFFSPDGRFLVQGLRAAVDRGWVSDETPRLRYWQGRLLSTRGGYDTPILRRPRDRYAWELVDVAGGHDRPIVSLRLAPLPAGHNKVPFLGPEQALPLWDAAGGCVVATDGTGAWLVRAALSGAGADTLALDLSPVRLPVVDREEIARLMGMAGKGGRAGYIEPTALRRLAALTIDPDGYAWLLPLQDSSHVPGGVEVVRISLSTGVADRDTVPAFPAEFGAPGVFYARTNDRHSGEATVTRYTLSAAEKPPR